MHSCQKPEDRVGKPKPKPTEGLQQFERLIGRLAQVPKSELDAEEANYKAMRKRVKERAEEKAREQRKGKA